MCLCKSILAPLPEESGKNARRYRMRTYLLLCSLLCFVFLTNAQETQPSAPAQEATRSAPPSPDAQAPRIRIGGNVQAAKIIKRVQPVYPPLARQTRIQGTVRLHVIIAKDGKIKQLEIVSGHPLLQQAALDAVRQWRYQPTLLNGNPVEVDTTIDVIFALNEGPGTSTDSASPSAPQPPIDPQLRAEILRLFDVMHLKEQTAKTSETMVDSLRPIMQAVLPVTPNREKIANAYVKALMELLDTQEFTDRTLSAYAKYFSEDDIKGLIQFYQTPAGQHFAEAMAPLLAI